MTAHIRSQMSSSLDSTMRIVSVVVTALVIATVAASLAGQDRGSHGRFYTGGQTRDEDPGAIFAHDLSTGEAREFYRPQNGHVFDFKVSPSGDLVAVANRRLDFDSSRQQASVIINRRPVFEETTLRIFTSTGTEVDTIPQVRSFAWSPDSTRLAYVTGEYRGLYTNYVNTKTWIWDAAEKRRTVISDQGYDVAWAKFDNNVYLWPRTQGIPGKALRYNTSTGTLEPTSLMSIYLSPTGDYYYHPGGGLGLQESVFASSGDLSLKETSQVLSSLSGWRPIGWAPNADLLLMEVSRKAKSSNGQEQATIIYNPKQDASVDVTVPDLIAWGETADEIVVKSNGRIQKKSVAESTTPSVR